MEGSIKVKVIITEEDGTETVSEGIGICGILLKPRSAPNAFDTKTLVMGEVLPLHMAYAAQNLRTNVLPYIFRSLIDEMAKHYEEDAEDDSIDS